MQYSIKCSTIQPDVYKRQCREKYGKDDKTIKFMDTNTEYRQNILSMYNVHDRKMFTLLKKSISFKRIDNIENFITENICDVKNEIDIRSMQLNVYEYEKQKDCLLYTSSPYHITVTVKPCIAYNDIAQYIKRRTIILCPATGAAIYIIKRQLFSCCKIRLLKPQHVSQTGIIYTPEKILLHVLP